MFDLIASLGLPVAALGSVITDSLAVLGILIAPLAAFAMVIHWLERVIQSRLSQRFGWKSVLWTGWLGTPIHELSHAAMCILFRHKIVEIALFEPDKEAGRLGYVRHSSHRNDFYAQLGNVFIGLAPLMGGSIVLMLLLWMFYPDAARLALTASQEAEGGTLGRTLDIAWTICANIVSFENLRSGRFWGFLYLVLCVGSHMAPSPSDYRGAMRGVIYLAVIVIPIVLAVAYFGGGSENLYGNLISGMGPLFALLALTTALCFIAMIAVMIFTAFVPKFFG